MTQVITASVLFLIAALALLVSVRSFKCKGFLLNNAYLYASEQERNAMDKKPYYRQSAVVFLSICLVFFLNGIEVLLRTGWIVCVVIAIVIITVILAIVSSIVIEKHNKRP